MKQLVRFDQFFLCLCIMLGIKLLYIECCGTSVKETNNSILYTENNWVRLSVTLPSPKGRMDGLVFMTSPASNSHIEVIWDLRERERERGRREREGGGGLRHPINGLRLRQTAVSLIIALLLLLFEVVRGCQGLVSAGDPCIKYLVLLKYKDLQNRERQDLLPGALQGSPTDFKL